MKKQTLFTEFGTHFAKPLQMEDFDIRYCRYLSSANYQNGSYSPHRYYLFRVSTRDLARFGLLIYVKSNGRTNPSYRPIGYKKARLVIPKEFLMVATAI